MIFIGSNYISNSFSKVGVAVNQAIQANEVRPVPIVKYCKEPPCNDEISPCIRMCSLCEERPAWPNLASEIRAHNTKCSVVPNFVKSTLFNVSSGKILGNKKSS